MTRGERGCVAEDLRAPHVWRWYIPSPWVTSESLDGYITTEDGDPTE